MPKLPNVDSSRYLHQGKTLGFKSLEVPDAATIPFAKEHEEVKSGLKEALQSIFPIVGKKNDLLLSDVDINAAEADPLDLKAQYEARLRGKTYATPFYGTLSIRNKETGKITGKAKVRLGSIPLVTHRGSYIVGGNEYYTSSIMRRKPGIYTKIAENGKPFVDINSAKGHNMKIHINEDDGMLGLEIKDNNIPLIPLLKALGTSDEKLEKTLGRALYVANLKKSHMEEAIVNKAHQLMWFGKRPENILEGVNGIKKYLEEKTEFSPEVNNITLGKDYPVLTADALLDAASKLIKLQRKEIDPDDTEHLAFKTIHSTADLMKERLTKNAQDIKFKLVRGVDKEPKDPTKILGTGYLDHYIHGMFNEFPNINVGEQFTPIQMLMNYQKSTVFGPAAINDEHAVTKENKNVSLSHFGFLDVFHTPEKQAGLVNQIALGTKKKGNTLYKALMDKNGKYNEVSPVDLLSKSMAFSDQIIFDGGQKPMPKDPKKVKVVKNGKILFLPWNQVDYVAPRHSFFFDEATNMVPFLGSDHGNRSYMAGKHMEQAVSLKYREDPLVRSSILSKEQYGEDVSIEDLMGQDWSVKSPVDGVIQKIDKANMRIKIKGTDGKVHEVPFYNNFHLNGGSLLDTEFKLKEGDQVEKGGLIGDSNFTRDGRMALGTNLRVAYLPYKGFNFDDGLVISEAAAKKLTSIHSHEHSLEPSDDDRLGKKAFAAFAPTMFTNEQLQNLEDDGVIKEGSKVNPGDPLILHLKKRNITPEMVMLGKISKAYNIPYKATPMTWDYGVPGEVVKVNKYGNKYKVIIRTEEPAKIGDKLAGRHGNKGVITQIVADDKMPRTGDGRPLDVLYTPVAVIGRTNVGQVMELAAGKIAEKNKKPYVVSNFANTNFASKLVNELKESGLSDKETVFDPDNGRKYKAIALGPQYMLKLHHMVEHKMASRNPSSYDANLQPMKGGDSSATAMDRLTFNAMLAHGAKHNLYEAAAYKAEKNDEFWRAFEANKPLPAPKVPFVFNKLLTMMQGMGIRVNKEGSRYHLAPATSKDILAMSNGEIKSGRGFQGRDLKEMDGGIFDPKVTGGLKGEKWSHITLQEPLPNPIFEDALKTVARINKDQLAGLIKGTIHIGKDGTFNDAGEGITGGKAIQAVLKKVDLDAREAELITKAKTMRGDQLNSTNKELRYIKTLKDNKIRPEDAYMMQHVPVIPPAMRTVYPDQSGKLIIPPANYLYSNILKANGVLSEMKGLPDDLPAKADVKAGLYQNLGALMGIKNPTVRMPGREYKGFVQVIAGTTQPKEGFFQSKIYSKRQDISGRSVISLGQDLHPDEIGLPEDMAWTMYRPFLIRSLNRMGIPPIEAIKHIEQKDSLAKQALENELKVRPVILNRAPTLHKFGIMAFRPRLTTDKTLQVSPLVGEGFNFDFDGDTMQAYIPVLEEARKEAFDMMPSKHLYNPGKEKTTLMMTPRGEASAGLWYAATVDRKLNMGFANEKDAETAYNEGKIDLSDQVKVGGKPTTVGRIKIQRILPKDITFEELDKKGRGKMLQELAAKYPTQYADIVKELNDFGNEVAPEAQISFGVSDINVTELFKERNKIIDSAVKKFGLGSLEQALKTHGDETRDKVLALQDELPRNNPMKRMILSGQAKGMNPKGQSMTFQQLIGSPLLMTDVKKNVVPMPIDRSYAEGLSLSEYLVTSFGSRQGLADKASSTADPGALNKEITAATVDRVIVPDEDPKKLRGIDLSVDEPDIVDRFLTRDTPGVGKHGDVVTPAMVSSAKKKKLTSLNVSSPLMSDAASGISQMSMGLNEKGKKYEPGTNIGIIAGQALSEPMTQMAMKSFHQGGIYGSGTAFDSFPRVNQILSIPKIYQGATRLSKFDGKVEKVEKGMLGGWDVFINGEKHELPAGQKLKIKAGDKVVAGQPLGEGFINPRELMDIKGLDATRAQMVDDLYTVYKGSGDAIKRRMVEAVVKATTDTTRVIDPGTSKYSVGDYAHLDQVDAYNKTPFDTVTLDSALQKETYEDLPGLPKGTKLTSQNMPKLEQMGIKEIKIKKAKIEHQPELYGVGFVPVNFEEDWLARLGSTHLKDALIEGAAFGQTANIHGHHPVPGWAVGTEFGKSPDKDPTKY